MPSVTHTQRCCKSDLGASDRGSLSQDLQVQPLAEPQQHSEGDLGQEGEQVTY